MARLHCIIWYENKLVQIYHPGTFSSVCEPYANTLDSPLDSSQLQMTPQMTVQVFGIFINYVFKTFLGLATARS